MTAPSVPSLHPDFLRLPIAHRALHDHKARAPENSLPAIRAAVAAGYAIEIDLQLSSDGVAMVFHDETLDRLTHETGPVRARSMAELRRIRVRDCPEAIPTLRQVLAEVAGRVPLLIELKDQSGRMTGSDGILEQATATALHGYAGPVAVMSFNPDIVIRMAALSPDVPRGLTTYPFAAADLPDPRDAAADARSRSLAAIEDYDRAGAAFVSHHWKDLDNPRLAALKAQGAAILCWTITTPRDEAVARRVAQNVTFEHYLAPIPV